MSGRHRIEAEVSNLLNDLKRPLPITKAAGAVSAVATAVALLVSLGVIPAADGTAVNSTAHYVIPAAVGIFGAMQTLVVHLTAKAKTTPVSDPRAVVVQADGTTRLDPLVPISLAVNPYLVAQPAVAADPDFSDVPV